MAQLTLEIEDGVLTRVRAFAERTGTTVEAMVRANLKSYAGAAEKGQQRARERMAERSRKRAAPESAPAITPEQQEAIDWMIARSDANAGKRTNRLPTREETYDRKISGHV